MLDLDYLRKPQLSSSPLSRKWMTGQERMIPVRCYQELHGSEPIFLTTKARISNATPVWNLGNAHSHISFNKPSDGRGEASAIRVVEGIFEEDQIREESSAVL